MKHFYAFISLLCLLSLSACSPESIARKIKEISGDKNSPPPVATTPTPAPPVSNPEPSLPVPAATQPAGELSSEEKDRQLQEEVNGYIQCLNRSAVRVRESKERYLSWVNEKTGPTCTERYITYGLYTLYADGVATCQNAAAKGSAGSPMQKNASELAAAYAELVPLTQKAYDYYQQQDYKDDACAKAKQMHPQLLAAFNRFIQAQSSLEASIDSIKSDLDQKELARIEQIQGKKLTWQSKNFMMSAERLVLTLPKDEKISVSPAAYLAAFATLEQNYTGFSQYVEANPEEGKGVFWFGSFESSAKDFFTKAKFLKRDLAEGKKPEVRSMNDVIQAYNRMVNDSNNVKFKY